jgi:hypothetical protein
MVDSDSSAVGLTLETLGILPFNRLKVVPIEGMPDDFHKVYLIYRKNVFQPRSVENFINFVKEFNGGEPLMQRLHMNSLGAEQDIAVERADRPGALLGNDVLGATSVPAARHAGKRGAARYGLMG